MAKRTVTGKSKAKGAASTRKAAAKTPKRAGKAVKAPRATQAKARVKRSSPARRAAATPPKPSPTAEVIVRQGFIIDATGRTQHAVPEVLVLGNRDGLRYLSDALAHLAEQAAARPGSTEPCEPIHLGRLAPPVNVRLSDALEFRFAAVTEANRAATFKRHGITMKSREHGSLFDRYREVAQADFHKVARRIADEPHAE